LIECLWEIFGGTINSKGYKELHPKIGAIYGDSITLKRQKEILQRLKDKSFASGNIVVGAGSYTYQYVTRDTHSLAMKATSATVRGKRIDIYKSPKTDSGKKSAKGLLMVSHVNGKYELRDQVTEREEKHGCLETIFEDGKLIKEVTLSDVKSKVISDLVNELA
jgi:nicotinamide phosphoribosyltransferase